MDNAELVKAYGPILIALFAMVTSLATIYAQYRTNQTAKAAKSTATEAKATADQVDEETQGIRRAWKVRGLDL